MSALLYHPVYGVASRSCFTGGHWEHAVGSDGHNAFSRVGQTLRAAVDAQSAWEDLLADLDCLLRRAERGQLMFDHGHGRTRVARDVGKCASADDVLELRIGRYLTGTGRDLLLRLYFTEPNDVPDLLLSLNLQHKSPGPLGLAEQDHHIRQAQEIFHRWDQTRETASA